jgi:hypothetical protein
MAATAKAHFQVRDRIEMRRTSNRSGDQPEGVSLEVNDPSAHEADSFHVVGLSIWENSPFGRTVNCNCVQIGDSSGSARMRSTFWAACADPSLSSGRIAST